MAKLPIPPTLQIERTQPVQGHPVEARFVAEGTDCGTIVLPFAIWIRLNKLIQKGLERQQIEGPEAESNGLRVVVKGVESTAKAAPAQAKPSFGGVSNLAREETPDDEPLDPEDAKAVAAAESQAATLTKLGRSLTAEEESND